MIKKIFLAISAILLFPTSLTPSTIEEKIKDQISTIDQTIKNISSVEQFIETALIKQQQQQKEEASKKLTAIMEKKNNNLLKNAFTAIKEETLSKALQIAVQNEAKNTVAEILKMLPERIKIDKNILKLLQEQNLIKEHKILNDKNISDEKILVVEKNQLPYIIDLQSAIKLFSKNQKLLETKS